MLVTEFHHWNEMLKCGCCEDGEWGQVVSGHERRRCSGMSSGGQVVLKKLTRCWCLCLMGCVRQSYSVADVRKN
jgi:hypothetical protein